MSGNQTWNNLGDEIKDAVETALRTGDFSHLNGAISDTVTGALGIAQEQLSKNAGRSRASSNRNAAGRSTSAPNYGAAARSTSAPNYGAAGRSTSAPNYGAAGRSTSAPNDHAAALYRPQVPRVLKAPFKSIGRISGTLYQVFGGIGTGVMAILSIVFFMLALGLGGGFRIAFGVFLILLVVFIVMINVGCRQKFRLRRAEKYWELSGPKHYVDLKDLALHTNKPLKYIVKDVRKMLEDGFFPQGHLDAQESCLMLDEKVYGEYLTLEKQRRVQALEQQKAEAAEKQEQKTAPQESAASGNQELDDMIAEGQSYIRRLHDMNDNIPGEVISAKLFALENLLKEIFDSLREHPEQMPQMQKFMNYYLPTTIKLVEAYEEFDSLSVQGDDIRAAKAEIEKTLDTINGAFGELLNKIFRDTAYDVTTDAQVLQTMLAKEGLAGGMTDVFSGQPEREKVPIER